MKSYSYEEKYIILEKLSPLNKQKLSNRSIEMYKQELIKIMKDAHSYGISHGDLKFDNICLR